jgi:hypothetical protein
LVLNDATSISSAMLFENRTESSLADAVFLPGHSLFQVVFFEEGTGDMYIELLGDIASEAPGFFDAPMRVRDWYMCPMRVGSGLRSLAWKMGLEGEPQDPLCSPVDVRRVWV